MVEMGIMQDLSELRVGKGRQLRKCGKQIPCIFSASLDKDEGYQPGAEAEQW